MQYQPYAPLIRMCWPIAEMRELADELGKEQAACSSYHFYATCERDTVKKLTLQIVSKEEADLEKEFPSLAVALYKSLFFSGCAISKEHYQTICNKFSNKVICRLLRAPRDTPAANQRDLDIQDIAEAYPHYKGAIAVENSHYLHYVMKWRKTGILALELTLDRAPFTASGQAFSPVELLALRLHCIMHGRHLANTQGLLASSRAAGAKAAQSVGLGFLAPEPTNPRTLSYRELSTAYVSISMDSQSSGLRKGYYGLPSETYGFLRLTMKPGTRDAEHSYYRFNLHDTNFLTPEDWWKIREKLRVAFMVKELSMKNLLAIFHDFHTPVHLHENCSTIFTNDKTILYLQTLIPLCLEKHLQTDSAFTKSLVQACEKSENRPAVLLLEELKF